MCEALGSEPVEEDIPVEFVDLPDEVQQSLEVYSYLPDRWEGMSGTFLGKDYSIVFDLFDTFDVIGNDIRQLLLRFMSCADSTRAEIIHQKQKSKQPSA
jgi:hypothetical protein